MEKVEQDLSCLHLSSVAEKKETIRCRVWKTFKERNLEVPMRGNPDRERKIPYFKGCHYAAERAVKLREFRSASVIKVNPSLAQMHLRFLALKHSKRLMVPNPAITDPMPFYLSNPSLMEAKIPENVLKKLCTKAALKRKDYFSSMDVFANPDGISVDFYVVASVAVAINGVRLGKGKGT